MERRLLGRQEGRTDDNLETIRKRFKVGSAGGERVSCRAHELSRTWLWLKPLEWAMPQVFMDSTLPIITFYEAKGRVCRINADRSPPDVYADVRTLFCNMNGA